MECTISNANCASLSKLPGFCLTVPFSCKRASWICSLGGRLVAINLSLCSIFPDARPPSGHIAVLHTHTHTQSDFPDEYPEDKNPHGKCVWSIFSYSLLSKPLESIKKACLLERFQSVCLHSNSTASSKPVEKKYFKFLFKICSPRTLPT